VAETHAGAEATVCPQALELSHVSKQMHLSGATDDLKIPPCTSYRIPAMKELPLPLWMQEFSLPLILSIKEFPTTIPTTKLFSLTMPATTEMPLEVKE
jgi:hypothetical protein